MFDVHTIIRTVFLHVLTQTYTFLAHVHEWKLNIHTHTQIRRIVSDFAVFIAVMVWVLVDVLAQVDTPKPSIPNVFQKGVFTNENRTYVFIQPLGQLLKTIYTHMYMYKYHINIITVGNLNKELNLAFLAIVKQT